MNRSITLREGIVFRAPNENDGAAIWNLVRETGVLDLNSAYSYLMLCKFFTKTCLVAEKDNAIIGFVSAFELPDDPKVIFVWQIAVAHSSRGKGLGKSLLLELLKRNEHYRFLEATISPSNKASQALFHKLAEELDTECQVFECFSADLFPLEHTNSRHETELTHRIGPFYPDSLTNHKRKEC